MNKTIIEAWSPSHLFFFLPYLEDQINQTDLIWHGDKLVLEQLPKELILPKNVYSYKPSQSIKSWRPSRSEANKYRRFLLSHFQEDNEYIIFSPFNYGIYFELLKQTLSIRDQSIFLYDDGMAGFLPHKEKNQLLKEFFYRYHGIRSSISSYRLYANLSLNKGLSINPGIVFKGENTSLEVKDISANISSFLKKVYIKNFKNEFVDNSAIIATHHSVENKRMTQDSYFLRIEEVMNQIYKLGIDKIYFSMHHQEDHERKYEQYTSLGLIPVKNQNIPIEIYCSSDQLKLLAQPFNTIPFMASSLGLLEQKIVVSYELENMPLINERISLINSLLREQSIEHYLM